MGKCYHVSCLQVSIDWMNQFFPDDHTNTLRRNTIPEIKPFISIYQRDPIELGELKPISGGGNWNEYDHSNLDDSDATRK